MELINFLDGAHLHDGSEYTGSYAEKVTAADIKAWHKARIEACIAAGVDGLAIETIPCQVCDQLPWIITKDRD